MESLRSQVKRQRIHPSVLTFFYASDELPPSNVEKGYLQVLAEERWPNTYLASASDRDSDVTGPTGVKMSGPYAWVPPNYWGNNQYTFPPPPTILLISFFILIGWAAHLDF